MKRRLGLVAEPYKQGVNGGYIRAGQMLLALGIAGAALGTRSKLAGRLAGGVFLAASAATRWGVFHAGRASPSDPKYTVIPQRDRLDAPARTS
jgi:hypothetical protein